MALTPSTMLPLGTALPAFRLEQVAGDPVAPAEARDRLQHQMAPGRLTEQGA